MQNQNCYLLILGAEGITTGIGLSGVRHSTGGGGVKPVVDGPAMPLTSSSWSLMPSTGSPVGDGCTGVDGVVSGLEPNNDDTRLLPNDLVTAVKNVKFSPIYLYQTCMNMNVSIGH